ncbi:unnamed protein product [Penicillium pancosmium]
MAAVNTPKLLQKWFPHTTSPFIANAPMLGFTDCEMANAVNKAGGFGFIGGGFDFKPESTQLVELDKTLSKARSIAGITSSTEPLPIGVGFITFSPAGFENAVTILEKHRVAAIWLSFPKADTDHGSLVKMIRDSQKKSGWETKIFVQVGTVQAAKEAIDEGVDVLVVQGTDAGGHQWAQGAGLMSLLPEVRDAVRAKSASENIAVLGAGGIVDGRGCVAALGLGADGIVMGTRFVATAECPAPEQMKQTIVSATDGAVSTVKSVQHDIFQSTDVWPAQYDGRAVIGVSYTDSQSGVTNEEVIQRYNDARKMGQDHRRIVWAGASVGVIDAVVSVDELIKGIQREVKEAAARVLANI